MTLIRTMKKIILGIVIVYCITQLCSCLNQRQDTKHCTDLTDSVSTNFARENTIYHGIRLWSMLNNPNKHYLCIGLNDTILVVTDSEVLFDAPLYSITADNGFASDFSHANIIYNTDIPFRAYIISEGDTLIYERNSVDQKDYNLSRGVVRNNIVNPNKNLFIGDSINELFEKIGLYHRNILDYARNTGFIIFANTDAIKYHSRLRDKSNHALKCEFNAVFIQIVDCKIYSIEYGIFGKYGMKEDLSLKEYINAE